ncbi:hypothetical protein HHK36_016952 [Tetracentron sinense]|uniref:Ubiquitin carboxyl-terminal hydrolase n=1 Tax=Tetracentron sinense TaxID=13715 RepID=A0A835DCD9_TETSI|nr:hypothetical protein HHK36_016952 [Tetracentron sinense]
MTNKIGKPSTVRVSFSQSEEGDGEILLRHSDFTEVPQPIEVAQAEAASTVENLLVEDPPFSKFTWKIENFSRLNTQKLYSEAFFCGGYKWRVLIYPKGISADHLSMYLDVADSENLPFGWSRYAQFSLAVVSQINNKYTVRKGSGFAFYVELSDHVQFAACGMKIDTQNQFTVEEVDWGFTTFMPLGELYDPGRGYLVNDTCVVEVKVVYDSKKETGFVGLENQGATCYLNSLLQTLYHIPYFRKAVYHMPMMENDMPSGSIPLALQSLYYKLQYSDDCVATKELTKSFGWNTYDSFMQHDVQELNRVLCEKLENKMKGTVAEGTIQQLFEGHHVNYIECINVDYKSTRKELFYDLQLDVKGCRDVYASFDKHVEVERLVGDNKYHAEQHGLQDAKKGFLFIDFPPVLQLQLKRGCQERNRVAAVDSPVSSQQFEREEGRVPVVVSEKIHGQNPNRAIDVSLHVNLNFDNTCAQRRLHKAVIQVLPPLCASFSLYKRKLLDALPGKRRCEDDEDVSINDRYEFPLQLDLDRENGKYLSPDADRSVRNLYTLHSVLVHSGGVHGGHYYAFIRPTLTNQWFKFDDEQVTKEDMKRVLEEQYGGEELPQTNPGFSNTPFKFTKYSNAYMLVYIRKSDKEKIICNVDEEDIAEHLRVARNEDLVKQIGRDIYFDLVDHDKVHSFRIQKQLPFNLFKLFTLVYSIANSQELYEENNRFWPNVDGIPFAEEEILGVIRGLGKASGLDGFSI